MEFYLQNLKEIKDKFSEKTFNTNVIKTVSSSTRCRGSISGRCGVGGVDRSAALRCCTPFCPWSVADKLRS